MDNTIYAALTRQSGLMREMQSVANNLANMSTTGFRKEGVVFAEHIAALENAPSLSMGTALGRQIRLDQGPLTRTGGAYDFAIEGAGFFVVDNQGTRELTRAGSFTATPEGLLATPDGALLLDEGETPITLPPGARAVSLGEDGTLSADGVAFARVGLFQPTDPNDLTHSAGTRFTLRGGIETAEGARLMQGFVEGSNVNPITEMTRMIEVQRSYEMGQALIEREDARIRSVISAVSR